MRQGVWMLAAGLTVAGGLAQGWAAEPVPVWRLGFDGPQVGQVVDSAGAKAVVQQTPERPPLLGDDADHEGLYGRCVRFDGEDAGSLQVAGVPFDPRAGSLSFHYKPLMRLPTIGRKYGIFRASFPGAETPFSVVLQPAATYDVDKGFQVTGVYVMADGPGFELQAGSAVEAVPELLKPGWHHVLITWQAATAEPARRSAARIYVDGRLAGSSSQAAPPPFAERRQVEVRIGADPDAGIQSPRGCLDEIMLFDQVVTSGQADRVARHLAPTPASQPVQHTGGVECVVRRLVPGKQPGTGAPLGGASIEPIAGAEVWVFRGRLAPLRQADRTNPALLKTARCDKDGWCRIPLPPGEYTVVLRSGDRLMLNDYITDPATGARYWNPLTVKADAWTRQIIVDVSKAVPEG